MEEEWMRDRALLRDLLEKTPHASPQELAQATGRSVELGEKMAQAVARRRSPQSRAFVLSFAGTSCPLLPLGPACRNPHHGDASCSAGASGAHARPAGTALLLAPRPGLASRAGPLASIDQDHLEDLAQKRLYHAQATQETAVH
jgi:hypothetical protein